MFDLEYQKENELWLRTFVRSTLSYYHEHIIYLFGT